MNDQAAPHMARIIAANAILDRGWGRPPYRLRFMRPMRGRRSVTAAPLSLSKADSLSFAPDYEQRKSAQALSEENACPISADSGVRAGGCFRKLLHRQHLEMRGQAGADAPVRSRQCHVDALQRPAQTQGLGLRDRQAINDAEGAHRPGSPTRDHHACDAARRDGVRRPKPRKSTRQEAESSSRRSERPKEGADDGADSVACGLRLADCDFNLAALHLAYPIKRQPSAQRTQAS